MRYWRMRFGRTKIYYVLLSFYGVVFETQYFVTWSFDDNGTADTSMKQQQLYETITQTNT